MNCKPGDLAIVVNSNKGNLGKIVTVICASVSNELSVGTRYDECGTTWVKQCEEFHWVVRSNAKNLSDELGGKHIERPCADIQLRPIRDQPGTDEMIRIAGKPNKEKVCD